MNEKGGCYIFRNNWHIICLNWTNLVNNIIIAETLVKIDILLQLKTPIVP